MFWKGNRGMLPYGLRKEHQLFSPVFTNLFLKKRSVSCMCAIYTWDYKNITYSDGTGSVSVM